MEEQHSFIPISEKENDGKSVDDSLSSLPNLKRVRSETDEKTLQKITKLEEPKAEEKTFIARMLNAMEVAEAHRPVSPFHRFPLLSICYIPEEFRSISNTSQIPDSTSDIYNGLTREHKKEVEVARKIQKDAFQTMFDSVKFPDMREKYSNQWIIMLPQAMESEHGTLIFPCATEEEALMECRRIFKSSPGFAFFVAPLNGDLSGSISEERRVLQALQKTIFQELAQASEKWLEKQDSKWMEEHRGKFLLFYKREISPCKKEEIIFGQEIHTTLEEAQRAGLNVAFHHVMCIREIGCTKLMCIREISCTEQVFAPTCFPVVSIK
jgi:hypothetical protein